MSRRIGTLPGRFGAIPILLRTDENFKTSDGSRLMGQWSPLSRTIELRAGMAPAATRVTLYHEWIHALMEDAGLHTQFTSKQKELLCDALGGLLAVIL